MEKDDSKYKDLLNEFDKPSYEDWVTVAEASLKGKPLSKITGKTYEGIEIKPIYLKDETKPENDFPAQFPFRRAKEVLSYKMKPWIIVQKINNKDFSGFNDDAKHKINNAVNGLKVTLRKDFKFANTDDLKTAFKDIDVSKLSLFFNHLTSWKELFDLLNKHFDNLNGGFDNDIIAKAIKIGGFEKDKTILFKELANIIRLNKFNDFTTFAVNTGVYRSAGCTAVQELAYLLATTVEYIRNLQKEGIEVSQIFRNMRLYLSTGPDFFMEIAKFRALRVLFSNLMDAYGENIELFPKTYIKSMQLNKSKLDIYVNQLRNTIEALSAIIGGVDAIEIVPFDYGINESSEFSDRITRNIQTVLREECNLSDVTDPAGGSYYIEYLTDEIANRAWELFQQIESKGGMIEYLKTGEAQKDIEKVANERINNINTRKDILLGTNKYPNSIDIINDYKKCRCKKERVIIEQIPTLKPLQLSEKFEKLRLYAQKFKEKFNHSPRIFIAGMGPVKQHKARVEFSTDFFHVAGFETIYKHGYNTVDEAVDDFIQTVSNVIVICSTDDTYPDLVPEFCDKVLNVKVPTIVILAGYPTEHIEKFKALGVNDFIHLRANIFEVLAKLQKLIVLPALGMECEEC
jgi:methylmalonyl-CoA mutase